MAAAGARSGDKQASEPSAWSHPLVVVTACWLLGLLLGRAWGHAEWWLLAAGPPVLLMLLMAARRRQRAVRCWALVALVPLAAAYMLVRQDQVAPHHIRLYAPEASQLAKVRGTIVSTPVFLTAQRGAFGKFAFSPPRTLFVLQLDALWLDDRPAPATGKVLVKIEQVDPRLARGQRLVATGWLSGIDGPRNPGEFDYRRRLADDDIHARLSLPGSGNYQRLEDSGWFWLQTLRGAVAQRAAEALRLGMDVRDQRFVMLQILLLGSGRAELGDLDEAFRRTGLAHLLSISGAHLAILMGLVWLVVKPVMAHPPRAALLALAVLALYLLAVPWQVPVVRAGVMAAIFAVGYMTGRRMAGLSTLALACLAVLVWRPGDLFDPGFQLSFGIVAGLLAFTRPVSQWLWPPPLINVGRPWWEGPARWLVDVLAANLVASALAGPLVAQHFGLLTPLAVVLSFLALPVVAVTLALGYLKIVLGLLWPSLGLLLAPPLTLAGRVMAGLVEHAAQWPGSTVVLDQSPGWWWTLGATALVAAVFAGWFAGRRATLAAATALCALWLVIGGSGRPLLEMVRPDQQRPAAVLNMFDVGNGSCFLLRLYPPPASRHAGDGPFTLLFDCGSQEFLDVGLRSIAPALRQLGVHHLDVLLISHADMDHFSGSLDVVDSVPVRQVWMSPQMLESAAADPRSPEAFLVQSLERRGLGIRSVSRGLRQTVHGGELELIWPDADWRAKRNNEMSLVLSVRVAGRRLLLHGDAQQLALSQMLREGVDLAADVTDLPHHGSFVDASPAWLEAVGPSIALQSSGLSRLEHDPWPPHLQRLNVQRLVTAWVGMAEVRVGQDGSLARSTYVPPAELPK